jgi:two-component system response regulator RegX3
VILEHPNIFPSRNQFRVALLEDDLEFAEELCNSLRGSGYLVSHFATGHDCLNNLLNEDYDVCLFDWHLPDLSGPEVMQHLKKNGRLPPVLFLTSYDSEANVTQILLAGADDYVTKPSVFSVLNARIVALLRRTQKNSTPIDSETLGQLTFDYRNKVITRNGAPLALTGTESLLAFYLLRCRGQIVARKSLYDLMGTFDVAVDTRSLDVHISHLRRKMGLNVENHWRLTSVYQKGYRLEYLNVEPPP